jgi:mannose/fructose/N-acetylgalactosamine-specific phosphotransferase system component IID
MSSIILAAFVSVALYFSLQGAIWGTYAILFVLSLNVFMIIFGVSLLTGLQRTYLLGAKERLKDLDETDAKTNSSAVFLVRIILLACVWHVYTLDYVLFAGIAATTVVTSLLVLFIKIFDKPANE